MLGTGFRTTMSRIRGQVCFNFGFRFKIRIVVQIMARRLQNLNTMCSKKTVVNSKNQLSKMYFFFKRFLDIIDRLTICLMSKPRLGITHVSFKRVLYKKHQ